MTDSAAIPLEVSAAINVLEKHVRACDPECVAAFALVYAFLTGRLDAIRVLESELRLARRAALDVTEANDALQVALADTRTELAITKTALERAGAELEEKREELRRIVRNNPTAAD